MRTYHCSKCKKDLPFDGIYLFVPTICKDCMSKSDAQKKERSA